MWVYPPNPVFNYEMLNTYFPSELKVFHHVYVWITVKCQNMTFMDILQFEMTSLGTFERIGLKNIGICVV